MKKMYFKKAMSLFMAVIMLLSCWVWVAPTEASAVNSSGNYTWRIYISCTNAYTGNAGYYTVTGKSNNGQGSDVTISNQTALSVGSDTIFDKGSSGYFPSSDGTTSTSFPYKLYIHTYKNSGWDSWPGKTDGQYSAELQVKDSSGSWKTICSGTSPKVSGHADIDLTISHTSNNFPTPTTIKWETENSADTADLTIGKTDNVTRTMKFNVYDQYGVRMSSAALTALSKEPTATVTASQSGTLGTSTSSNIYYTLSSSNTDAYYITVTAKPGAKSTTYDSQTITVGASCNSKSLTDRSFTLYDPNYTFTMNPNGGGMVTPTTNITKRYHNTFGYTPNASRTGYTLIGFYTTQYEDSKATNNVPTTETPLTSGTYIDSDLTWYAAWQANLYTITFKFKDEAGKDITVTENKYHNETFEVPDIPTVYVVDDYDFVFQKWSEEIVTTATKTVTYIAEYDNGTFVGADYTGVNEAIAAANAVKTQYGTEYELKYTHASRTALDAAINAVVTGLGRTQQATVDGYAQAINNAIAALDPNKFDVIFLDKNGAIILYEKDAEYKSSITAPALPEDQKSYFDAEKHYTYTGWDTNEYTSVVDDLVISPVYTAEAHDWKIETVTSTCVQAGTQKYTCKVCGYVKYDGGDQLGDHVWASDFTVDLEPTCVLPGSKSIHCTLCDAQKDVTVIPANGHNWGDFAVAVTPSCDRIGISTRVCAEPDCRFCEHLIIDPIGHNYTKTTVAPTCTAKGYDEYTCQNDGCGHTYRDNYTDVIAHSFGDWETVSKAYCEVAGVKKRVCTKCGFTELGSIDALVHDDVNTLDWNVVVAPTCEGKGYQTKICSKCNNIIASEAIPALNHSYVDEVVAPTCTTKGYTKRTCSTCGDVVYTGETAALNHAWTSTTHPADCTHSSYIEHVCGNDSSHNYVEYVVGSTALGHNFAGAETVVKAATCEADGEKTVKCTKCDETNTVIIPKLGHDWSDWVKVDATNDKDGSWTRTCKNDEAHVETVVIPKGGHNLVEDTDAYKAPTCKEKGQRVYKCTNHENCSVKVTVELDFAQHTVTTRQNEATCTGTGTVEAYCSVCNKVFSTQSTPIKAHNFVAGTPVDSTCTESGYTPYKCSVCDFTYNVYDAAKPAKGHDFSTLVSETDATCTADGEQIHKCSRCAETKTTVLPKLGHSYVKTSEAAADCTTPATEVYECSVCKDTYTKYISAAKGHTWSEWSETQAATADKYGIRERTCSACNAVEIAKISPIGAHNFTETITKPATCTAEGEKTFTCSVHSNCAANYTEKIPATGHTEKLSYVAPTCFREGSTQIICSVCNTELTAVQTIPMTAHAYDGGVVTAQPTCIAEGTKTFTCTVDGCTATRTEPVSATGHNLTTVYTKAECNKEGSVVTYCQTEGCGYSFTTAIDANGHTFTVTVTPATCTASGTVEAKCDKCGYTETTTLEARGHNFSGTETVVKDATCTAEGEKKVQCLYCEETTTVAIPAKGHTWAADWTVKTAATCEADGEQFKNCENCSETISAVIPKLGHDWNAWVITPATNDKDGSWTRTCKNNEAHVETVVIPKGGHNLVEDTSEYKAPTCKEKGERVYKCTNHTDCSVKVTVELDFAQHTISTDKKDATCTEKGYVKTYCSVCGEVFTNEETEKIAHVYEAGTAVAPTCTTSGYIPYTCKCGDTYNVYDATKPATGHSFKETGRTDATCDTDGSVSYKCENCAETKTEVLPKLGHSYSEKSSTPADCTTPATKVYECGSCKDTYTEFVSVANGHSWGIWTEVQQATADKYGIEKRICSVCKTEEFSTTAPIGDHEFTGVVMKEPTCTETGTKEWTCSKHENCSADYTETLSALGHKEKLSYTAPTCTGEGSTKIVCESCNEALSDTQTIPAINHAWNDGTVTTAPTCTTEGIKTYTCGECGATKTETLAALGHELSTEVTDATCEAEGTVVTKCSRCTFTEKVTLAKKGHIWKNTPESTVDAKCETDGSETYKCQNCDKTNTVVVPKLGHNWGAWTVTKASTNTEKGELTRTCSRGCKETAEIPEGGHSLVEISRNNSTCTVEGSVTYGCNATHKDGAACGITVTVMLPLAQHSYVTDYLDSTCDRAGHIRTECSVCHKVIVDKIINRKAHVFDNGTFFPSNCTEAGYVLYNCVNTDAQGNDNCNYSYKAYNATDPAKGHKLVPGASTASCTDEGLMTLSCERCTYSEQIKVPALGHNYVKDDSASTEATCAAAATETYNCSRCNASYTVSVGDKTTEHSFGGWQIKESATATSIGYRIRICDVCGKMEVETIKATGEHVFDDEIGRKDATCTEDGYVEYKCSTHTDCGITDTVILPKLGHTETLVYTPASCEADGSAVIKCSVCNDEISKETIDALGHLWSDGTVTAANCKEEGKIEYSCTRAGCNATHEVSIGINANAHAYETQVVDATCTADGYVITKCTICDDVKTNETLAAKGHTFTGDENETKKATCEENGSKTVKCADCDATQTEVIAKLGHDWGEWKETKASTNTEKGELTRTCSRGCTETVEIPAGGHNLVITDSKAASCTDEGYVTYGCDAHNNCGITVTVTLAMIQHELETTKTDATCEGAGTVVTKCKKCDTTTITTTIPATGHTYDDGVKTDATCTATGKIVYTCVADGCGKTREVILEKLQHNYEAGTPVAATCTTSGYTPYKCETCDSSYVIITAPADGHNFSEEVSSTASCTAGGKMTLKCADCDATMTADVPALGHNYVLDSTTEATCAAAATETYKCSRCTAAYTVSVGSKTENHDWNDWVTVEKATYTSIGYKTSTCKLCDKLKVETIPATGEHNLVEVDRKAATCEENGYINYECDAHTDCGIIDTVTLPKLGHTEELQYKAATCEEAGYAKTVCTECTKTIDEETIPVLGHVWGDERITLSTCTEKGKIEFTCTSCNTATKTVELPVNADAHKLVKTVNPASCTDDGYVVISCELCKAELERETLLKVPHTWGEWVVTTPATNAKDGVMTRTCANGCTETAKIPAGGHTFGQLPSSVKDATCTKEGEATYKCTAHTDCGVEITVKLDKIQHTIITEYENATCTKEGFVKTYCDVCKEEYSNITIGMLAHEFEVIETVDPTCTSSGYTTYKCKNCEEGYSVIGDNAKTHNYKEVENSSTADCENAGTVTLRCDCGAEMTVDVPALGHDWVTGEVTKATCQTEGRISFDCSRCSEVRTETLPKVSHDLETTVTDATCTTDGKVVVTCKFDGCDYTDEKILSKLGHTWADAPYKSTAASCETEGSETYKCINCTEEKTVVIPALGHVYEAGEKVAPTCLTSGYTVYVCKHDNSHKYNVYNESEPALDHDWGAWVTTPSTNAADGKMERSCQRNGCDETETVTIPKGSHAFSEENATVTTPATCTSEGKKVYKCTEHTDCGVEVTVTLAKIAHKLETNVNAATCTEDGKVVTSCTECDTVNEETVIPATGHTYDDGVKTDATCTKEGKIVYTCMADGCGNTREVILDKLQHSFVAGEEVAATCTSNGYIPYECSCGESYVIITAPAKAHNYIIGTSTADCENAGVIVLDCEFCDSTIEVAVPALGHDWGKGTVTKAPTCVDKGEITFKCTRCNETRTEELDTIVHELTTVTTDATCTEDGSVVTSCKHCDYEVITVIKKKGHTWADTPDSTVAAKCEQTGSATYKCINCAEEKTVVIPALGHVYEAGEKVAATCLTSGYTVYVCKHDNSHTYNVYDETQPATDHTWGDWTVVTNATEDTDGLKEKECTLCHKKAQEVIPAMKHNMTEIKRTESTCSSEGSIVYKCSVDHEGVVCSYTLTVTLDKLAHTLTTKLTPATCEENGSVVTSCTKCDAVNETTVLPATGHKYKGTVTTPASCENEGVMTYVCENNAAHTYTEAIPATGHKYEATLTPPTCTAQGFTTHTCSCGESYVDSYVDKLGHTFGEWTDTGDDTVHTRECVRNGCDSKETQAHKWDNGEITTEPTYISEGEKTYTCHICDATKTEKVDALTDNTAPSGKIKWEATIWNSLLNAITFGKFVNYDVELEIEGTDNETGISSIEYYVADNALSMEEIEALTTWTAYDEVNKLTVNAVDAEKFVVYAKITDNNGNITYISTDGIVFDTTEPVLDITADNGSDAEKEYCSRVTITISEENFKEAYLDGYYVPVKNGSYSTNEAGTHIFKVVDMAGNTAEITFTINDGHTASEPVRENLEGGFNCTEGGSYDSVVYCAVCGEEMSRVRVTADPAGHKYESVVTAPTCTTEGFTTHTCSVCGDSYVDSYVEKAKHNYQSVVTEPTCTEKGYTTHTCSVCGDSYVDSYVEAENHSWGAWVTDKKATCTESGEKHRVCQNDASHVETVTIKVLGHDYGEWIIDKKATCLEDGEKHRVCQNDANHVETVAIKSTGHSIGDWYVTDAPTCTEEGAKARKCAYCDYIETASLPAKGHAWSVWVVIEGDCELGYKQQRTCSNCGETEKEGFRPGSHQYHYDENGDIIYDDVVYPTCTKDGYYIYDCEVCGGGEVKITVETPGYEEELRATGHNFGDWIIISEPTCFKEGTKYRICANDCKTTCGLDTESREYGTIPAKQHEGKWIAAPGKEATCTEDGYTEYHYCADCGFDQGRVVIPAKGHHDSTGDMKCDSCGYNIYSQNNCDCMCHDDNWFVHNLYKLIRFFWKLFKINKVCECGYEHY